MQAAFAADGSLLLRIGTGEADYARMATAAGRHLLEEIKHKGKGKGGGQFTAGPAGGGASDKAAAKEKAKAGKAAAKEHAGKVKASEKNVKTLNKTRATAEKAVIGAAKKKDASGKKHEKQLDAVKAATASLAKAKTPAGKKAAQKRIDAATEKAKGTEAAHQAASDVHAQASAAHATAHDAHAKAKTDHEALAGGKPADKMAAVVAEPVHAPGSEKAFLAKMAKQKEVLAKYKNASAHELNAKSHIAEKMKTYKPTSNIKEATEYARSKLGIQPDDLTLGSDMEVNNHVLATFGALKEMGFKMPYVLNTEAFIGMNKNAIGGGGQGMVNMNPSVLMDAVKGQVASQESGVPPKWFSTNDPAHFVTHELGHVLHESGGGFKDRDAKEAKFQAAKKAGALDDVSEYGKSEHREMVAEVFAGKVLGKTFSKATMDMYKACGGPMHHSW